MSIKAAIVPGLSAPGSAAFAISLAPASVADFACLPMWHSRVRWLTPSVDTRQIEHRNYHEHRRGLDQRDHEDVLVGILVRQSRHGEQRDDRAVVRQGVHAAARH